MCRSRWTRPRDRCVSSSKMPRSSASNCSACAMRGAASCTSSVRNWDATQPGMTIVCGDSHTSTHGAFGALAFGIGTTEVGHVFATQTLLQRKPKTFAVNVEGRLRPGVTAKDLILAIIGKIGVSGGTGHVLEYRGSTIRALSMDERMTVCNMSIEAGARAGMIAPDDTTFAYLEGKPRAPRGADWDAALAHWRTLRTRSRRRVRCGRGHRRRRARAHDHLRHESRHGAADRRGHPRQQGRRGLRQGARATWDFTAARPCSASPSNVVFIGSCTNGRLEDLQAAAQILKGRKVAPGVRLLIVPGSQQIKRAAEAAGLRRHIQGGGRRLARIRLLDVPGNERRHRRRRPIFDQHQQSQFRGPARRGRPDAVGESAIPRRRARCGA